MTEAAAPGRLAVGLGLVALALILGALGFEYLGGYPPCEICMWQRWPHYAAIVVGLGGGIVAWRGTNAQAGRAAAAIAMALIAGSGAIAVYHAGVEWHVWAGPAACTGPAFKFQGALDLNAPVAACDRAAWRLFGLSLAGYNAIISLGTAGLAAVLLMQTRKVRGTPA
jgi:disulfide bond formation protein DsbB